MYQSVAPLVGVGTHLTVNSFMDEKLVAGHNRIQLILYNSWLFVAVVKA